MPTKTANNKDADQTARFCRYLTHQLKVVKMDNSMKSSKQAFLFQTKYIKIDIF